MPLISVIVPVYKAENVLKYCIGSILNQTFTDYELVLVNDGSPDNSGDICDEYAKNDDRIRVIHQANSGVSSARNTGIDNAKGEYICFVDSDDYISEDYLEKLVSVKNQYPQYDNVWCELHTVLNYDENLKSSNNDFPVTTYSVKDIMTLHEEWLDAGPTCKLYNKETVVKNGLKFDINLTLGEDLTFNFQYLDCTNGSIVVIEKKLYHYVNTYSDSLSNKYYENMFAIYKQLNSMMLHYIKKWNCDESQFGKYYSACFFKYEVVLRNTFHSACKLSKSERYKLNKKIMKSDEFINSMNLCACKIHPLYRFAYKSKSYKTVQIVEKMIKVLRRQ